MRRTVLVLIASLLVAAAGVVYAQTGLKGTYSIQSTGPVINEGGKLQMKHVTIKIAGGIITADEALIDQSNDTKIELVGAVRLELRPIQAAPR